MLQLNFSSFAFLGLLAFLVVPDVRYAVILFLESLNALALIALLLLAVKVS